jgi:glycosyltransferase involved in cell wall biosynthesis
MPLFFKPKKSIVVALDFAYKYFKPKNLKERLINFILFTTNKFALKKADKIVSISDATKKDTVEFFGIRPEKVDVIYPGFKNICELTPKEMDVPENFFLYVGVIKERKNLLNIVKGFYLLKQNTSSANNYKLVVAGKGSGSYYEKVLEFIKEKKLEEEIIFVGFISDEELSFLYQKAKYFVFPSVLEGFGFPIIEAMSCGTPVITSNRSSLGEIAHDAAILVDPDSSQEISEAMAKAISDQNLRNELIEKGYENIKNFSWEKSALKLLKIIKAL